MGISHDIISEFVKITNDKKEKPKEETVYATIVQASDGKYVKIDGSDLITPTETTTDIEEGERVTVLIKDHSAIITGNISSPSASVNRVNGIADVVSEKLGVFEHIVADKIDVNELNAYKATVEYLIAGKAEIDDLKATRAEIGFLDADVAHIKTLVNGNLTSDNILSFNITADKVTMADAFIKDAMVASINAAKINAGRINTNNVVIGSDDGGMLISGATQQFTDKDGKVRIQIGRDSTGDFTFVLYGEDGTGQIINQNGITASAVSDGLIVNDMINDKAAISGGKLDISSVIFEINNENDTAIHSSKIYLDEQNQSLEAAFNSLKTQVDTIVDISIDGDLKAFTEQIQSNTAKIEMNKSSINTLVSEDAIIRKEVSDLEGNLIETTNTLSSKYTSLKQSIDGFKLEAADVYATKRTVEDLENNLTTNYTTTEAMNSAITQKANEINLEVTQTINSIQTGGKNLIRNGNFEDEFNHWEYGRFSGVETANLEIWDGDDGYWCMDGKKHYTLYVYDVDDSNRQGEWTIRQSFKTVVGQEYTISYMIAGHRSYKTVAIRQDGDWAFLGSKNYGEIYGGKNANDWVYDSITFTATTSETTIWFIMREVMSETDGYMWFTDVCCVEGNKAQRFIPSLEEYSTTTQMNSAITQKADEITSTVNMTKLAGGELLPQGYRHGDSTSGYSSISGGKLKCDELGLYTTERTYVVSDYIAVDPNLPIAYEYEITNADGTPYTYLGVEQFTRTTEVVDDSKIINFIYIAFRGTKKDSGIITLNSDTRYIRLRWMSDWSNNGMSYCQLSNISLKQLGSVNFSTQINQLSDRITATVSSVEMVNGKVNQANSDIGILSDRITSTVSSIQTVDGKVNKAQSQIDQQANQIASKVNSGDLSSLIQQNSSSIYTAISNGRGVNGIGIDTSGLYLHNNDLVTARLTEGKFHAYNSWNGNYMGYFGTNGDDLRACLYGTNTFSVYSNDTALLFKARYDRDASYGNATLDMCGGINFIHKPGQSVGINQIVLGNDDRADIYGYHNLSIRAHNSLGFMDNNGYTHMFFATRTGSIVMKGTVYQNSQSGISTFSLLRSREVVNDYGYTTEDMVNSILTLETSVNVDENEDYSMRICSSEDELVTKILGDSLHIDQSSVIAGLVETVKSLNNRILELESELKK